MINTAPKTKKIVGKIHPWTTWVDEMGYKIDRGRAPLPHPWLHH